MRGEAPKLRLWVKEVRRRWPSLEMDPAFAERNVNEGFSGGEKKRHEILQMELLKPRFAILDETDSGLDVDALRVVSQGVNRAKEASDTGILLITHYTRILRYIAAGLRSRDERAAASSTRVGRNWPTGSRRRATTATRRRGKSHEFPGDDVADAGASRDPTASRPTTSRRVRRDFPILSRRVHNDLPLVYLDSAATSQKPTAGTGRRAGVQQPAQRQRAPRHSRARGRGDRAVRIGARDKIAAFIDAPTGDGSCSPRTPPRALNLVAHSLGSRLGPGDEVVISEMEHHSNIVPWQLLCERTGATLKWFGLTDDGRLDLADGVITERTKIVSVVHQSNILGTINPVASGSSRWPMPSARTCVLDGCQSVPHHPISVRDLGVDFLAFSGHKMCGPTGIGVLWGRRELLAEMPPFLGGGEMIEIVTMARSTFAQPPHRFEAGTPPIAQAVALGAAVDYLTAARDGPGRGARARHHRVRAGRGCWKSRTCGSSGRRTTSTAGRGDLLRARRPAPARRRPGARRAGHRGAGRPPLRPAGLPALRHPRDDARVLPPVLDPRRGRRAGGRSGAGTDVLPGMNLESMYQEIILDHYRHPHHKGLRDPFDAEVHHVNPTCGDEVTLRVVVADGTVEDVSYDSRAVRSARRPPR